ncbi:MAG: DNA internalization-related competence protein ComEC/Rec2 [Gammaproteobacteria bacterium]
MVAPIAAFTLGVLLVQQLPELPGPEWLAAGLAALGLCLGLRYWKCVMFMAGLIWAIVFADRELSERLPKDLEAQIIKVSGQVTGLPVPTEQRVRFDFSVNPNVEGVPSKLRLSWYYPEQPVKAGQQWAFAVKLKRPHGNLNPGGFDYERWLFGEGIGAVGYVRNKPPPVLLLESSNWYDVSVWRQTLSDSLDRVLAAKPNKGVIKALTIGDRNQLSSRQWDIFRQTGTVHLMAISGLHIGLIAGLMYFLVSKFWVWAGFLSSSPQKIAAAVSLLVAVLYSALAGFSVPTRRALVMLSVVMLAVVWQRNARPANTLSLALFAVLLFDPLAILSAGFWLSFVAVSMIAFSVAGRLVPEPGWRLAIRLHGLTALALSPFLLFYFQQISLVAPVANFVAVPIVSLLVVPVALLASALLGAVPSFAELLLVLVDSILQGLNELLAGFADLPFAYLTSGQPSVFALILAVGGLLMLLAPRGIPARWLGSVMLLPLFFVETVKPRPGEVVFTLLDVGQGLSAVVQTAHHALVFDAGARFDSGFDMGEAVLVPFLRRQGVNELDVFVGSHGDNDHVGGAAALMKSVAVKKIYSSVPDAFNRNQSERCEAGMNWVWDRVRFTMLAPGRRLFLMDNDNSCVLRVESEFGSLLLTGDIEQQAEAWLVQIHGGQLQSDVLVAPHHGSNTSSTLPFLTAVKPAIALIPAGYKNRFGFPDDEVLRRYTEHGIKWFNAAEYGALTVHLAKPGLLLSSQRLDRGRYWNMKPE